MYMYDNDNRRMIRLMIKLTPFRQYRLDSACSSFVHAFKQLLSQLTNFRLDEICPICPGHVILLSRF